MQRYKINFAAPFSSACCAFFLNKNKAALVLSTKTARLKPLKKKLDMKS